MNNVKFQNNSEEVKNAINSALISGLYASAGEVVSCAKQNSPVDTGQLKNSWSYVVDEDKLIATIGSPLENAIWNEWGTGEFALHGDGRKGGWCYQDAKGKWHRTNGKRPQRTLQIAFNQTQNAVKRIFENEMKAVNKKSQRKADDSLFLKFVDFSIKVTKEAIDFTKDFMDL